jgi:hypothetical protein
MEHGYRGDDDRTSGIDRECHNCGGHVTPRFARVMGGNDDKVYACPSCHGFRELSEGAGAVAGQTDAARGSSTEQ